MEEPPSLLAYCLFSYSVSNLGHFLSFLSAWTVASLTRTVGISEGKRWLFWAMAEWLSRALLIQNVYETPSPSFSVCPVPALWSSHLPCFLFSTYNPHNWLNHVLQRTAWVLKVSLSLSHAAGINKTTFTGLGCVWPWGVCFSCVVSLGRWQLCEMSTITPSHFKDELPEAQGMGMLHIASFWQSGDRSPGRQTPQGPATNPLCSFAASQT